MIIFLSLWLLTLICCFCGCEQTWRRRRVAQRKTGRRCPQTSSSTSSTWSESTTRTTRWELEPKLQRVLDAVAVVTQLAVLYYAAKYLHWVQDCLLLNPLVSIHFIISWHWSYGDWKLFWDGWLMSLVNRQINSLFMKWNRPRKKRFVISLSKGHINYRSCPTVDYEADADCDHLAETQGSFNIWYVELSWLLSLNFRWADGKK